MAPPRSRETLTTARLPDRRPVGQFADPQWAAKMPPAAARTTPPGTQRLHGEVTEWPKVAVLKTAVPQGTGGSNPSLSEYSGSFGIAVRCVIVQFLSHS